MYHPSLRVLVWRSAAFGVIVSMLLFIIEAKAKMSSPMPLTLPGWLVIISLCGFDPCAGRLPLVGYFAANAVAYFFVSFMFLLVIRRIFGRREDRNGY